MWRCELHFIFIHKYDDNTESYNYNHTEHAHSKKYYYTTITTTRLSFTFTTTLCFALFSFFPRIAEQLFEKILTWVDNTSLLSINKLHIGTLYNFLVDLGYNIAGTTTTIEWEMLTV